MSAAANGQIQWKELTLSLAAEAHSDLDLLADVQALADFYDNMNSTAQIVSLHVLDEDDQAGAFDVVFMKASTTLGTEGGAFAPADAVMRECVGLIKVVAADYRDYTNGSFAIPQFNPFIVSSEDNSENRIWVGAVSRDTKTYTAAGLRLRIGYIRGMGPE